MKNRPPVLIFAGHVDHAGYDGRDTRVIAANPAGVTFPGPW
jgi:hypothetical protein